MPHKDLAQQQSIVALDVALLMDGVEPLMTIVDPDVL